MSIFKKGNNDGTGDGGVKKIIPRTRTMRKLTDGDSPTTQQSSGSAIATGIAETLNQDFHEKDRTFFIEKIKDLNAQLKELNNEKSVLENKLRHYEGDGTKEEDQRDVALAQKQIEIDTLRGQKDNLLKKKNEAMKQVEESKTALRNKDEEIKKLKLELQQVRSQADGAGSISGNDQNLQLTIDELEIKLAEANRVIEEDKKVRLGTLKELQAARKECEDYAEDLKRVTEERDELARKGGNGDKIAKDLADLQKKFQDFKKKKEAAEEQVNSLQAYIDKQNEKLSKAEESIKSKDAELVKLREKSVKLSNDLLLISNSTESTTTGLQEKIQQLQNKLDATEKEKKELAQNFEKLNAQHTELSTKFDRLNKELQAARDVLTTQKKTIAAKEKEISALQQTLAQSSSSGTAPTVVTTIVPDEEVVKERDSLLETVKKQKERIQQLTEANETTQEVISQLRAQEKSRQMYQPAPITIETSPIVRSDSETEVDAQVRHLNEKIQQLYLENANRKLQAWELEQDKYNIVRELQETRKKVIDINNERKNDDQRVAQRFEEQIRVLNANLESAKATNDKLTSELEKQNRELRELSIKMRSVKEFNEELKGEVTHLRQKLSSTERQRSKSELPTPKTPTRPSMRNGKTEDESSGGEDSILLSTSSSKSRRNEKGVIVNPATSHALYRKQQILLDPLGSVKRSVLAIIEYFDMRVEQENTTIDTIGYGRDNPALVHIIHTQLCAALVAVFQHGFSGPFWLLTTAHYWHMIEEIVDSYQNVQESGANEDRPAEEVFALQLRKAVRNVNNIINREIQYELKTGRTYSTTTPIVVPQNEHELKFRALVVSLLNDKLLNVLFKFLMHDKHRAFWKRFYDQNALLRQLECQNKLITYLSLLMKLPFEIEVETTCKASSYVKEELTSAFELE